MRLLLIALLTGGLASAQDPLELRVELRPRGEVWVGQRVSLYVTVVMDRQPARSPRFELPQVDGAIFLQAPGSPVLGTERSESGEYTTQRFELMLFAQRAGELQVPAVGVRVQLGEEEYHRATDPLTVQARLPAGVEPGTPLITTAELTLEQSWDPEPGAATVGAAFTRTITIRAKNVLGLAIPPAPLPQVEGLATYPTDPIVDDRTTRGALAATRTDVVTLVCTRPGRYEIPDLLYTWWNPGANRLDQRVLVGAVFEVLPDPMAVDVLAPVLGGSSFAWWWILLLAGFAGGSVWIYRDRAKSAWNAWCARRAESEAALYRRLIRACKSSDPRATWHALLAWVGHFAGPRATPVVLDIASEMGLDDLRLEAERLQIVLLNPQGSWTGADLAGVLVSTRRALSRSRSTSSRARSSLNPEPPKAGYSLNRSIARGLSR